MIHYTYRSVFVIGMNRLIKSWGDFLGEFEWNVFLTIHFYSNYNQSSSRGFMTKLFNRNKTNIDKMFFVSEFNNDFNGVHSHSLLEVRDIEKFKKRLVGVRSVGDVMCNSGGELVKTNEGKMNVGYYVSKFIDRGIDYEFLN